MIVEYADEYTDMIEYVYLQNGSTALMMASLGGYLDIVHFLVDEKGATLYNVNCVSVCALCTIRRCLIHF